MSAEALGPEAALSRSTTSRICARLRDDFEAFCHWDLTDVELDYLFLDGSHFKMHDGSRAEPVLVPMASPPSVNPCCWPSSPADASYTTPGQASRRSHTPGVEGVPLLVISDGAASVVGAIETTMASALRQRCHITEPETSWPRSPQSATTSSRAAFWAILRVARNIDPGTQAVHTAQANIDAFARRYQREFPAAVKCLLADRRALTAYLRFPVEHGRRIRHTNLVERTFGETRRRVKVIGQLPGEASCLLLVWAVLDRASQGWRCLNLHSRRHRGQLAKAAPPTPAAQPHPQPAGRNYHRAA